MAVKIRFSRWLLLRESAFDEIGRSAYVRSEAVDLVKECEGVFCGGAGKPSSHDDDSCESTFGLSGGETDGESAMPIVVSAVGGLRAGCIFS